MVALISHASKILLKILQASLWEYFTWKLKKVQIYTLDLQKAEEPEIKLPTSIGSQKKARELKKKKEKKNNYFCFIDYSKAFDYVHHNKLWRILRDGTRPPCQFPEKPVCRTRSNSWTLTWNNKLIQHVERSTSGLYTITLLMKLICRVRQGKYQSG